MIRKLYSTAHVKFAKSIFPDRLKKDGWLDEQWTDDEINACKLSEMQAFIDAPSLSTYGCTDWFVPARIMPGEFNIVRDYCRREKGCQTFLSVGCGQGQIELLLARENPNISFVAIDNAPYVESLNAVARELKLANIQFKRCDLRQMSVGKFDIVYSFAVIYCIPDYYLTGYFELLMSSLNPGGRALVGCSSNYSLLSKMADIVGSGKNLLGVRTEKPKMKVTGWQRDIGHVRQNLPQNIRVEQEFKFNHKGLGGSRASITHAIGLFSKWIYPVSNSSYMFVLRN